jgi:hypothetical protein
MPNLTVAQRKKQFAEAIATRTATLWPPPHVTEAGTVSPVSAYNYRYVFEDKDHMLHVFNYTEGLDVARIFMAGGKRVHAVDAAMLSGNVVPMHDSGVLKPPFDPSEFMKLASLNVCLSLHWKNYRASCKRAREVTESLDARGPRMRFGSAFGKRNVTAAPDPVRRSVVISWPDLFHGFTTRNHK